ncbi:MAG: murI [Ilumatobacteraceae bacterium]|nr:murI [Ilumatobacteraceae bacterium]
MTRIRIGLFDSGVGGLSILRAVRRELPDADLLYVADSAYAPYGERPVREIVDRCLVITEHFVERDADVIVVACNTATAAAIATLRATFPDVPFVGVEPGLKPAVARSRNGRIGVLATQATIESDKFRALVAAQPGSAEVHLRACPGLAAAIEAGDLDGPEMTELVEWCCTPLRSAGVDTVVLGCTHYEFVRHHIERAMGTAVEVLDTAEAVARQTERIAAATTRRREDHNGHVDLRTTGDERALGEFAERWLAFPHTTTHVGLLTSGMVALE